MVLRTPLEKDQKDADQHKLASAIPHNILSHSECWLLLIFQSNHGIPHLSSLSVKLLLGLKPAMGQYPQLSTIFPHFLSPSPYFTLLSIPSASSYADKKDFKFAGQSVGLLHALDHITRPKTQFPLGETGRGRMQDNGEPAGREWVLKSILYCLQWLPGGILIWSQRCGPTLHSI